MRTTDFQSVVCRARRTGSPSSRGEKLPRAAEALSAGQELIVAAPGNTDNYEFVARLCFQLGKPEEGLTMLRKAVRISPQETHLLTALATALAEHLRTDEAIELYWRAFEKSEELDDRTSLTMKLVPLYQQLIQYDQLIERLERRRRHMKPAAPVPKHASARTGRKPAPTACGDSRRKCRSVRPR